MFQMLQVSDHMLVTIKGSRVAKVKVERLGPELFRLSVPFRRQFNHFWSSESDPLTRALLELQKEYVVISVVRVPQFPSTWWLVIVSSK